MTKKKKMPSAPIIGVKAYVKGVGKKGQYEGGQVPFKIDPKFGSNGGKLNGQILGKQGT